MYFFGRPYICQDQPNAPDIADSFRCDRCKFEPTIIFVVRPFIKWTLLTNKVAYLQSLYRDLHVQYCER